MARNKKKIELPAEGAAFAMPLEDGRYSVCRVIHDQHSEQAKEFRSEVVMLACSAWIDDEVPDVSDESLRPILHLTHHAWDTEPQLLWVSDEVPEEFIPIGTIEPMPEDKSMTCKSYGGWGSMPYQALAQWRWDHDREAVLAEDRKKEEEKAQRLAQEEQARRKKLLNLTLEELQKRRFFPNWKESPSKKAIRASRKIMKETVKHLIDLGPRSRKQKRMAVLQECIERFNALDVELGNFIETIEREDICEEFELIQHACGLGEHEDLEDEWREW